jgi:antitoxin MazE
MKTRIVRIGNSQGIRIPKLLLERSNLAEEVELQALDNQIIIRSAREPREGWGKEFQTMAAQADDRLLDNDSFLLTQWDANEWQW